MYNFIYFKTWPEFVNLNVMITNIIHILKTLKYFQKIKD